MNDLIRDIWHDLRTKRLWPVAAALALGLVAIPAVMMKSAVEPAATPVPAAAEETSAAVADIEVTDAVGSGIGSSLDHFSARDPFQPPKGMVTGGESASAAGSATAGPSGDADGGAAGGGAPSDDGGGTGTPSPAPVPEPPPTVTAEFEYVADVTFWWGNRRRSVHTLHKLDMLPNQSAPVLIFMGVTANGGNAVFLVDSTLKTAGEGRCVPSRANCAYVNIGPGSEHVFTTEDGDSYRLRVDEIRRVEAGGKASGATAHTADGALRRFALPSLIDLVAVTGPAGSGDADGTSDDAGERR